ncbi:MAG TPA: 4-hydroxybenzoate octaprenyltransferase [Tepidisphaeraceae bacterium]|nr:4-hydroxybenzoate octaprenyltransferase [Tepidisphaeraceae bacterium]
MPPATSPPTEPVSASLRLCGSSSFLAKLKTLAQDIKLSHTLFALPFALLSAFLAADGWPDTGKLLLILLCMFTARTVAMSMNRLIDAELDSLNPRTQSRALPSGSLSSTFYMAVVLLCSSAFIAATALFGLYKNIWPVILSLPILLFISAYPFLKRFTQLCHYYLGAALALAPICSWIAVKGNLELPPLIMAAAVLLWTAGFDIIYACQDYQSDLQTKTFSIPAKFGLKNALLISRLTHVAAAALLITLGLITPQLRTIYFIAVALSILLLIYQHTVVKPHDLSRVNLAFFTINGMISLLLGTLGIIDVFVR